MPPRRYTAKRRTASTASGKSAAAAAAARAAQLPPPLFYTLARATLREPVELTKVVAVTVPMAALQDKAALHEHILRKLLHKPYTHDSSNTSHAAASAASAADGHSGATSVPSSTLTVVHMDAIEVHVDTIRQANAHGDVQMNVMLTLGLARVQHGLLVGVAEASPYANCMQVSVPVTANDDGHDKDNNSSKTDASVTREPARVRVTVRCLDDEPVVVGQAVLVVSEPGGGGMRCMAIRPPRLAPAPFALHEGNNNNDANTTRTAVTTAAATMHARHDVVAGNASNNVEVVLLEQRTTHGARGVKRPRTTAH